MAGDIFTTFGAILAIVGTAIIVSLAIIGGVHVLTLVEERVKCPRPIEPSDDLLGDLPNVPEISVFHNGTDTRKGR